MNTQSHQMSKDWNHQKISKKILSLALIFVLFGGVFHWETSLAQKAMQKVAPKTQKPPASRNYPTTPVSKPTAPTRPPSPPPEVSSGSSSSGSFWGGPRSQAGAKWSLEASPLGLAFGVFNFEGNYPVTSKITAGGTFSYVNRTISDATIKGTSFGANARYHLNRALDDGWYAGTYAGFSSLSASFKSKVTNESFSVDAGGLAFGFNGGYGWFWNNFYMRGGLLLVLSPGEIKAKKRNSSGSEESFTIPASPIGFEFNLGWAFH